jgi:hypothetical protein
MSKTARSTRLSASGLIKVMRHGPELNNFRRTVYYCYFVVTHPGSSTFRIHLRSRGFLLPKSKGSFGSEKVPFHPEGSFPVEHIFTPKKSLPDPEGSNLGPKMTLPDPVEDFFKTKMRTADPAQDIFRTKMWAAGSVPEIFETNFSAADPVTGFFKTKFWSADSVEELFGFVAG